MSKLDRNRETARRLLEDDPSYFSRIGKMGAEARQPVRGEALHKFESDAGIPEETSQRWDDTMRRYFG